jgi:hypothetical protein
MSLLSHFKKKYYVIIFWNFLLSGNLRAHLHNDLEKNNLLYIILDFVLFFLKSKWKKVKI